MFIVGASILGTGIWLIATEHSREMTCKATGLLPGASAPCQAIGWAYFLGFVVAAAGLIVVLFTGLMKRHEHRQYAHPERPTEMALRMGTDATERSSPRRRRRAVPTEG
jgi:hypothetical protein